MTKPPSEICRPDHGPLVSVLMNCYNGEKYLRKAVESVIAQTHQNWEIIFWDNQSSDNSAEIFKSYPDQRLKYFYAQKHTLLYEARNYALANARGDFITFLDADDYWLPEKLEVQIKLFNDSEVGFVYSNYYVETQGGMIRKLAFNIESYRGNILERLLSNYDVGILTLAVRKSAFPTRGNPFDENQHIIGDFDLVIRLSVNNLAAVSELPLAVYRVHENNESRRHRQLSIIEKEKWLVKYSQHPVIGKITSFDNFSENLCYSKSICYILMGEKIKALMHSRKLNFGFKKIKIIVAIIIPTRILLKFF